ncbi:MAG: heme NO-binding domain-containing protein [Sphingomonadales bacterium]|nr:heme NO-binding domain-containing protein [Sphingomonadaceae bacterium]MBS3929638.1 heme NO-binding domain-containing protein [Sphingomonadales bacterium]
MYGMIHRAIRGMVIEERGESAWNELEHRSGIGPAEMISAETYDDEITLRMLAAASDAYDMPINDLLVRFGRYWIVFAERGSFKFILDFTGQDLRGFISNLDRMHVGVQAVMPQAIMPSFRVAEDTAEKVVVEYRSTRTGLEPFVTGLFQGLAERFGVEADVQHLGWYGDASTFAILFK